MMIFVLAMILRLTGAVSIVKVNLPVEIGLNYKTSFAVAKESLKNNFFIGSGPATYGYNFSLNRSKDFNQTAFYSLRFFQGTGIFAESLPTIGFAGTFFLAVLALSYLGSQFYFLYKEKEKNKLYSLGIFSAAAVLIVSVFTIRTDGALMLLTVLFSTLALATALAESENRIGYLNLSLKASPKFALALAFIFMVVSAGVAFLFVFLGKIYAADIYAGRSAAKISSASEIALSDLSKAINLSSSRESKYYVNLSQYYMALVNQEVMKKENERDLSKIRQYLNYSIAAAVKARDISPRDVSVIESLAVIYENASLYVSDSLDLAQENYQKALELEPHNPIFYAKLGKIKISLAGSKKSVDEKKNLLNESKGLFQKAIEKKESYAEAYYQLALVHEALDELDQAIENGLKAVKFNSRNSNYILVLGRIYQNRGKGDDLKLAEQYYKTVIALNDKDINGHFYLGLFYEKNKNKDAAKNEYKKVISLLSEGKNNQEIKNQIEKMISNVDKGIENTPESLGLVKEAENKPAEIPAESQPADVENPTINEVQP